MNSPSPQRLPVAPQLSEPDHLWPRARLPPSQPGTPSPLCHGFASVESILPRIGITKQAVKKLEAIQMVREQRENGKQVIAYHARPFVLCGIPLAPPARRPIAFIARRNGKFFSRNRRASAVLVCRRSEQTALVHSSALGWAEIVHPFHPLRGRRFEVLKKRRIAGVDTLILRELERGTLSIPREWTDWADPTPYDALTRPPHRLAADCLFELVALLEALAASRPSSPEKTTKKRIDKGDA